MKWKLVSLAAVSILTGTHALAGSLEKEHVGCSGGYKTYALDWDGPWSEELIFMQRKWSWQGDWDYVFFIGYLDDSGKYYPVYHSREFRMMAQPSGGTAYKDSNEVEILMVACGPPQ